MISRSMEYCPQCGVRDPAGYNIQAPAVGQVEGRKRSNFLVPFLGIFDLTAPAAWQYSPRSAAPRRASAAWLPIAGRAPPQNRRWQAPGRRRTITKTTM
jgi:hypothetical protein